jgi:hypothetical protein
MYGRTPRIEVDGLDISDENVGTTTQNVALSSIQEFNISRSNLDLSTELTSAGAVNVATRSGTNALHGMAFYGFRDRNALMANFAEDVSGYYQRNNFGGRVGGPIVKDKLFFFIDGERMKQDGIVPVAVSSFAGLNGGFNSPFRDTSVTGKLDWNATKDIHVYRFSYNWNISESNFGYDYSVYSNRTMLQPSSRPGLGQGSWSHNFRFGYLKFHNQIAGDTSFNLCRAVKLALDGEIISGPNLRLTPSDEQQIKYDGSKVWRAHFPVWRGRKPDIRWRFCQLLRSGTPGHLVEFSNVPHGTISLPRLSGTVRASSEKPAFGYPGGGQADTRFQWYVAIRERKPNFTLSYGLRYNRDTGRSDSDLTNPMLCPSSGLLAADGCTGNLLDMWGAGLGDRVRNPNKTLHLGLDSRGILRKMVRPSFVAAPACITRTISSTTLCLTARTSWHRGCFSDWVS